jgi:two-component system sensor histidine kinase PilS (NtrC family)
VAEAQSQRSAALARQLRWLIGIRLVVITSFALAAFLLQLQSLGDWESETSVHTLAGITYAASLVYIALLKLLPRQLVVQAYVQFFGDLVLVTALVWNSGGVNSPFSSLYVVVIIVASYLVGRRAGLQLAAVAWIGYSLAISALAFGWVSSATGLEASAPAWRIGYSLVVHLFGFSAVALLTSHLTEMTRRAQADLTAKKKDLALLQNLHQDIVESIPSGLMTTDETGAILTVNRGGCQILGLDAADLIGSSIHGLGLIPQEVWETMVAAAHEGRQVRDEVGWDSAGTALRIGFSLAMLRTADVLPSGYILIFQDLTPYRKLQEEIQLKDRMAAVGELAAGIAHEVGNPLAAISGSVQMLHQSETGDSPRGKLLQIILKESQRLDRTIKGFLQYAQPLEQRNRAFDVGALLEDELQLLRNSPEVSERHRLELDIPTVGGRMVGDPDQVSQIFWNLSQNALRAMPRGGTLRVEGRFVGDKLRLRFTDTGRGMDDEEKASLFHPFRSFFDTGSGIGMAIVYRIVQDRKGHLAVASRKGFGTTITVELPTDGSHAELAAAEN